MSDRRRRDPTLVEGAGPAGPAAPSFGSGGREATIQDPYRPAAPSGGYSPAGDIASPAPSWSSPSPAPAWQGAPQQAPAPMRPAREATTVDGLTGPRPGGYASAPSAGPGSYASPAVQPGRQIAGWLLSADRMTGHVLRSGSNLVGRDPQQDILIDDPLVSGLQCNIICEVDATLLMPRPEARNPTMINGKRIYTTEVVPPLASVQFGNLVFVYVPAPRSDAE